MPDAASIEICLLDNDLAQLDAKKRVLSATGWQTRPFTDPDAFLSYARVHNPDIAILEFGGPRTRGLQIRARLREVSPATRAIIGLRPIHKSARDMLWGNELINLIKQYVGTERRQLQERNLSGKRKVKIGFPH